MLKNWSELKEAGDNLEEFDKKNKLLNVGRDVSERPLGPGPKEDL